MPFNVLFSQAVISNLPLEIAAFDQLDSKLFLATADGSILEYSLDQNPFSILLEKVYKQIINQPISTLKVLINCKSILILHQSGLVSLMDYTSSTAKPVPLQSIKNACCISKSLFSLPSSPESLAIGIKRAIILYTISRYLEVSESAPIKLPSTPKDIHFISISKLITATKMGIYLVDHVQKTTLIIFSVPSESLFVAPTYILSVLVKPVLEDNPAEVSVFCSTKEKCYKLSESANIILQWSATPTKVVAEDYYLIAMIEDIIEVRSIKTGSLLQTFTLQSPLLLSLGDLALVANATNLWRLLPLDFDEQIDELLQDNRFEDAEIFLNELEFDTEEEKLSNVVKVKGVYAQYLFNNLKKYNEAIAVLESLKASPLDIIELYREFTEPDIDLVSDKTAILALSVYLAKERKKLIQAKHEAIDQVASASQSMISFRSMNESDLLKVGLKDLETLLEFVETCLIRAYLIIDSPLLKSLLRADISCEYTRIVDMLLKYEKFNELVEFYKFRGENENALTFLKKIKASDSRLISYLKLVVIDTHLELVLEYAKDIIARNPLIGITIFTGNYQKVSVANLKKIISFLDAKFPLLTLQYLEFLVLLQRCSDTDINTSLCIKYLEQISAPKTKEHVTFTRFVKENKYYDSDAVLREIPKDDFLLETVEILSRINRHEDALRIYALKLNNWKLAESYCIDHYKRNDDNSSGLFTILYQLLETHGNHTLKEKLMFLNKFGFRMSSKNVLSSLDASLKFQELDMFLLDNMRSLSDSSKRRIIIQSIQKVHKEKSKHHLFKIVNKSVVCDEDSMCMICMKRLASTLCTIYPDGRLCHTYCASRLAGSSL